MEFYFNVASVLRQPIAIICADDLENKTGSYNEKLIEIIDEMGIASAKAQHLKAPITTWAKLARSQRLYIIREDAPAEPHGRCGVAGILKMGEKNLFLVDDECKQYRLNVTCCLDFYIVEKCQRRGFGKRLFQYMLEMENNDPARIAYDRPSPKLLNFLRKHYNLMKGLHQPNNFVIFKDKGLQWIQAASVVDRAAVKLEENRGQKQRAQAALRDEVAVEAFNGILLARDLAPARHNSHGFLPPIRGENVAPAGLVSAIAKKPHSLSNSQSRLEERQQKTHSPALSRRESQMAPPQQPLQQLDIHQQQQQVSRAPPKASVTPPRGSARSSAHYQHSNRVLPAGFQQIADQAHVRATNAAAANAYARAYAAYGSPARRESRTSVTTNNSSRSLLHVDDMSSYVKLPSIGKSHAPPAVQSQPDFRRKKASLDWSKGAFHQPSNPYVKKYSNFVRGL